MSVQNLLQTAAAAIALGFAGTALAEPGVTADKIIIGQGAGFTGSVAGTGV